MSVLCLGPLVSQQHADRMISGPLNQKIQMTLFDIGEDKALRLDGYSSYFFKKAWNIVGHQICQAVKEFFNSGSLLK